MLALLLAAPSLALLPRHSKLSCSRSPAVASRAPPLVAQEGRLRQALQGSDEIDGEIMGMALPSIANFAVIPLVGAVDTMWVGRMGSALALAGQGAAGQSFFSTYFLTLTLTQTLTPTLTRREHEPYPLVRPVLLLDLLPDRLHPDDHGAARRGGRRQR